MRTSVIPNLSNRNALQLTPRVASEDTPELPAHVDILVVGAGLSGIGVAAHLATNQPGRTMAIVDARDHIGGTWDLFRYPGIRSDSDLHTFGYEFKSWTSRNAIADGHEILAYLEETVADYTLAPHIFLGHRVTGADFSTATGLWTVTFQRVSGLTSTMTCAWLFSAAGYYDHSSGFTPLFEGQDDFAGDVVHPQAWPENLDYTGKDVVVIGSGATAVTIVPAIAEQAGHVTMLQRSPTYVISVPRQDPIALALNRLLPAALAYRVTRAINVARMRLIYWASQRYPKMVRRIIRSANVKALPEGYDVDTHFNPTYNPWEQRLCTVPDGDLFDAISRGLASIVTDRISHFTRDGIVLESGARLRADVIVTATGLNMIPFGGVSLKVDGDPVDLSERLAYKGMMVEGVPNFAFAIGYTNSSWTLKIDLVAEHLCRLLAHLDRQARVIAVPVNNGTPQQRRPFFDFAAGYVRRAAQRFPSQGSQGPWTNQQAYAVDRSRLRHGPVDDPGLTLLSVSNVSTIGLTDRDTSMEKVMT